MKIYQDPQILIILHGWQSSKEKWQKVKEEIKAQGIKVIIPDLPGFKKENELKKAWSLDDYLEWAKGFVEEKVRGPFFLLGQSFGGGLALKFAARHPEKLSGLILVSPAVVRLKSKKEIKKTLFLSQFAHFAKKFSFLPGYNLFRKFIYYKVLKKPDYIKAEGYLRETFKNVINEDLTPLLSKIKTPTLIVWGGKDRITPLKDAYLMKEKIDNSKLEILKDIGHIPHLENPKLLSQKIVNFISEI